MSNADRADPACQALGVTEHSACRTGFYADDLSAKIIALSFDDL
jgi:hypothetical protein